MKKYLFALSLLVVASNSVSAGCGNRGGCGLFGGLFKRHTVVKTKVVTNCSPCQTVSTTVKATPQSPAQSSPQSPAQPPSKTVPAPARKATTSSTNIGGCTFVTSLD